MTLITHEMSVYASRDTNRRREEMTDRYSMREAREVLKTNEKSLKAWMRKEGIEPQIDLMDERKKYITRAQVEQLARRHGRTLPEEHEEGAPSALPSVEALAAHITMTQQVLERRIDQVGQEEEKEDDQGKGTEAAPDLRPTSHIRAGASSFPESHGIREQVREDTGGARPVAIQ